MKTPNPQNIPGIFNYCNRWCERCPFSDRCTLYQQEHGDWPDEDADMNEDAFWDKLKGNLENSMDMLQELADEQGIDLNEITQEEQEEAYHEMQVNELMVDINPLSNLTSDYLDTCLTWVKNSEIWASLHEHIHLQSGDKINELEAIRDESLEVIQWYMTLIPSKVHVALNSKEEADFWDQYPVEERHYNGIAKLILVCLKDSLEAWEGLESLFSSAPEQLLYAKSLLSTIESQIRAQFPDAELFKRPGFDS
ncbi:hypothetical protein [Mongoliitalea daihaiensis]|uniref:hypothetical protein n=1 Tax=Mongoliitalea daihaiensis TaxID=2782006 RepID=UPI001F1BE9DB|nr:hypothetical protein [Mongoliitalea daihaiensis]UJP63934.1 hypothetical protein IPZ59_14015 [Mongoliitalea daihaiensis]